MFAYVHICTHLGCVTSASLMVFKTLLWNIFPVLVSVGEKNVEGGIEGQLKMQNPEDVAGI